MAAVAGIVAAHYSGPLPARMRAELLPGLLRQVGGCMAARHTAPREPLWRAAAAAFQASPPAPTADRPRPPPPLPAVPAPAPPCLRFARSRFNHQAAP